LLGEQFDAVKQVLTDMSDAVQVGEGKIAVPTFKTFQLSKIFGDKDGISYSKKFETLYENLTNPHDFPYQKPEQIKATLRPYQEDGVRWMNMLSSYLIWQAICPKVMLP